MTASRYRTYYVAALLALMVFLSIAQGQYTLDPHHWGLMLSNAADLWGGKSPYKEVFIQYGFLTTVLQALAFGIGGNLLSLITITSFCYALGVWIAYRISTKVLLSKNAPLYVVTGLFLFHPLAIYPWANYIAFPFLMYGIYALVVPNTSRHVIFFGGIAFALAVLAREGLLPAISLLILLSFIYDSVNKRFSKDALTLLFFCCYCCMDGSHTWTKPLDGHKLFSSKYEGYF